MPPPIADLGLTRTNQANVEHLNGETAPVKPPNARPVSEPTTNSTQTYSGDGNRSGSGGVAGPGSLQQGAAAEQGHADATGSTPTAAQLEFARKTKEREDTIKQNASIKESNRDLNEQIRRAETTKTHLSALSQVWDLSASFTRGELNDFTNSATLSPEIKAAARWLLSQSDADLAALGLKKGAGGVTKESISTALAGLEAKLPELRAQIRPELPVPGEPVPPATPTTSTSPSTGTDGPNAPAPQKTPEQANAEMYPNASQVPPFSSTAATGEGRMLDASAHLQNKLDAMEKDLAIAAANGNQAAMTAISAQIAKLQAGMTALMQMLKQRQEMESNMSKMFSEMASSAIRNMR
ncbi:MAG: hypothetical protein Q8S33_25450 [Myxococcales bacterium]|nr:hypothetical protein [Myxococcales bacterium]